MKHALSLMALFTLVAPACLHAEDAAWIALSGVYIGDVSSNLRGGEQTGTASSHLGRAEVHWNAHVVDGIPRQATRMSVMYMDGRGIGPLSGDLQGLNNIDAPSGLRLYEFWTEAHFGAGMSLRGGFLDLNTEFDVPATSAVLVSPPHGIGTELAMSGRNGPAIWPVTGLGLRLQGDHESRQWRVAVFEGEPGKPDSEPFMRLRLTRDEGALLVGELSWAPAGFNKLQLGTWHYTGRFEPVDPAAAGQTERGNHGAYALVDMPVARIGSARVDAALRVGAAAPRFNQVDRYLGLALAARGFAAFPEDAIGLGIAHASTTPGWRAAIAADGGDPKRSETALELTWRHAISDGLAVLPHLHFVKNPGALYGIHDTWVAGLRVDAAITSIFN